MDRAVAKRAVLVERRVDDPYITSAELAEQARRRVGDPRVGKIMATVNELERIGCLVYVKDRLAHHEMAAARFKADYEALYGSGMPAVDAGKLRVDTSIKGNDGGMAGRIDRADTLKATMEAMGPLYLDRVIACVVLGIPCHEGADILPSGKPNWRQVEKLTAELLAGLDIVAEGYGYRTRAA